MDMTGIEFGQPPPAESAANLRLDTSLRVGEFLDVPFGDGQTMRTWVVYPLRNNKAPAVIVVHEKDGLTDWIRAVTDQAAAEGYLAAAPDLTGTAPEDGASVPTSDAAERLGKLSPTEVAARLAAVRAYVAALPQANGRVGMMGFAWGGTAVFAQAAREPALGAAVVYYGEPPTPDGLAAVRAPIMAHYGQNDTVLVRGASETANAMKRLKKTFQPQVYKSAFGPFLRVQEGGKDGANEVASVEAWLSTFQFFRRHLGK